MQCSNATPQSLGRQNGWKEYVDCNTDWYSRRFVSNPHVNYLNVGLTCRMSNPRGQRTDGRALFLVASKPVCKHTLAMTLPDHLCSRRVPGDARVRNSAVGVLLPSVVTSASVQGTKLRRKFSHVHASSDCGRSQERVAHSSLLSRSDTRSSSARFSCCAASTREFAASTSSCIRLAVESSLERCSVSRTLFLLLSDVT